MIEKIRYKSKEFKYPVFEYLYSRLFEYAMERGINISRNNTLEINYEHLIDLATICSSAIQKLLDKFYTEPSERQLSKNPNRYRKIIIGDIKYMVNYRTDQVGREIVGINYLYEWLISFIDKKNVDII